MNREKAAITIAAFMVVLWVIDRLYSVGFL